MSRMRLLRAGLAHVRREHLARRGATAEAPPGPPLSVAAGLTARCTYRCMHCRVWEDAGEEYDAAAWRDVFRQIAAWMGPAHVALAGGEPFLRPDLGEIVQAADEEGLLPSVVTNGALPIDAREVASWPLVSLTLSVDSLDPLPHDTLHRCPGAHRKVMDLAERLCAAGMAPRLRIAAVLAGPTADGIVPLARWVASRGIGGFTLQPLGEPFGSPHDPAWYPTLGLAVDPRRVAAIVGELMEGVRRGWPVLNPSRQLALLAAYYEDPERSLVPCTVGTTSLGIGPSGELRFCPYLPAFGHADRGTLRDQWHSPHAARAREAVRSCTRGCSIMNCTFSPTLAERLRRWRRYAPGILRGRR